MPTQAEQQPPIDMTTRRAAQLLKDLEVASLRMEQEPRRRVGKRRVDARRAAEKHATIQETTTSHNLPPPNARVAVSEPTSYKRTMAVNEHDA